MSADLFVHLPPLTPIEARVLYGLLAAWCNDHPDEPVWPTVDQLRTSVAAARDVAQQAGEVAISF